MLKIGEFSKLSLLTVKTRRFYEREGLLVPAAIDEWTGYRMYETGKLEDAARIKAYRQLGLSIAEIGAIQAGAQAAEILEEKAMALRTELDGISTRLRTIEYLLEGRNMECEYQIVEKDIPACIVYCEGAVLDEFEEGRHRIHGAQLVLGIWQWPKLFDRS